MKTNGFISPFFITAAHSKADSVAASLTQDFLLGDDAIAQPAPEPRKHDGDALFVKDPAKPNRTRTFIATKNAEPSFAALTFYIKEFRGSAHSP